MQHANVEIPEGVQKYRSDTPEIYAVGVSVAVLSVWILNEALGVEKISQGRLGRKKKKGKSNGSPKEEQHLRLICTLPHQRLVGDRKFQFITFLLARWLETCHMSTMVYQVSRDCLRQVPLQSCVP